jgi:hypothetical protein
MSETNPNDQKRQIGVRVNEQKLETHYANAFRTHAASDEVLIDFGFNLVQQVQPQADKPDAPTAQMNLDWNNRIVMSYRSAKNLAVQLGQLIRAYEDRFGEIKPPTPKG